MPKHNFKELEAKIAQEKAKIEDNVSLDPAFHEKRAARILAYSLANEYSLTKATAHASLATSLRLKELMSHDS